MQTKHDITKALNEEKLTLKNDRMNFDDYAHHTGWMEALEWVLSSEKPKQIKNLLEGANDETIKKSIKGLAKDCGFGRRDDVSNSEIDSIYNSRQQTSNECSP